MNALVRENPGFGRLWAAAAVSQVGDWLSFVAVAMLAMTQGGDAFGLALVFAAHALPWLSPRSSRFGGRAATAIADVFPVAGITLGWPANEGVLSPRLPLAATVHHERFDDARARELVDGYDRRRHALMPYRRQRDVARFGEAALYGWSEDKARQYADSQRADFGAYVRAQGFKLD